MLVSFECLVAIVSHLRAFVKFLMKRGNNNASESSVCLVTRQYKERTR
jgi:hypothetical protein